MTINDHNNDHDLITRSATPKDQRGKCCDWEKCETGTLASFSVQEKQRHARGKQRLLSAAIATTACVVLAVGVFWESDSSINHQAPVLQPIELSPFGGLSCHETKNATDAYFASELLEDSNLRIEKHLNDCPHCQRFYQKFAADRGLEFVAMHVDAPTNDPNSQLNGALLSSFLADISVNP